MAEETKLMGPMRVILVEDHPVVRKGLVALLTESAGIEVVGEADSGLDGLALYRERRPDIAIVDLRLPGMSGIQTVEEIRREFPDARCVILSTSGAITDVERAFEAGARAYLNKGAEAAEILATLHNVHEGRRCVPQSLAERLLGGTDRVELSGREFEVLRLAAAGFSNKLIATELGISEGTVKTYMTRLMTKLHAEDRTGAVVSALRAGLLEL